MKIYIYNRVSRKLENTFEVPEEQAETIIEEHHKDGYLVHSVRERLS